MKRSFWIAGGCFAVQMISTLQLKLMLRLLGCPGYRSPVSALRLQPKLNPRERDQLCRDLKAQGWLDFEENIQQFTLAAPGRVLLKLDSRSLPVTPDERTILQACQTLILNLEDLPPRVPLADRKRLVRNLVERGLLKVKTYEISEVWLTRAGLYYLRDECQPQGHTPWLSSDLLSLYLEFLRSSFNPDQVTWDRPETLDAEEILQIIQDLNQDLNLDNYLPLFYLREKVQPPLTRESLNQILYDLQRRDRLELCSIQEVSAYTPQQLQAAIPQASGGALFFVSLI